MREYLIIENTVVGKSLAVVPGTAPYDVAALNEPMAVALHCVNRAEARTTDKVVVFGAGPIGLGATIRLKLRGVAHVAVADVIPERPQEGVAVGADAVIDSSHEDVTARLTELHGQGANALGQPRSDTDIYIDAAGAPAVVNTALASAKWGARLVMVAVQKKSKIDLSAMLHSEMTLIAFQGYPGLPHRDLPGDPAARRAPGALREAHQSPRPLHRRRARIPTRARPERPKR